MNTIIHGKNMTFPTLLFKLTYLGLLLCSTVFFPVVCAETQIADTESKDADTTDGWLENIEDLWFNRSWLPQSFQIHGFLSQGLTHTSDNNFFGHSDDSVSFDFRELGINGSWRIIPDLQLSLQLVMRDAGLTDNGDVRADYGLADYSFYSTEFTLMGVRAGRVPTPLGFYNDTRDVASTRPGILLPQSIYFDVNRNIALSADGGYFYGEQRTDYGDFLFHIGVVNPRTDDPDFKYFIVGSAPGKMEGDTSWVTRLNYEWQSGLVRLAITYADFNAHFNPEPTTSNFNSGDFRFNPLIFSAQYNAENWSLTAEYALRRLRLNDFGLIPDSDTTGESFYIQGIYNITPFLQGMVRYDSLVWDKNDKKGYQFAAATGLPNYSRFAEDWTFGLRYAIIPKLLVSAEYHIVNGTGWLSGLENPEPDKTKQHWDLFMMMISYDF